MKENQETIAKLEQELKNANELLSIAKRKGAAVLSESDIEQLSPAAACASKLLKSGMTLTQIYSEYVNLSETLQSVKDEKSRVEQYLNEVMKELEERAPLIKRQKQEYDEAMTTINNLSSQLENAMMEYEVLKSKSEDSIKKYNSVSSENIRLKQDVGDLSRQVTVLLYEVEQLRSKGIFK
jgi:nucleoprotein TPR